MELILKVTEMCNFSCTFCSSTDISDDNATILDISKVFEFLKKYPKTRTIILNGGDPLMISPDYYWDIIKFLDENDLDATLSFTTNLWPFYKNPSKWEKLFKHWRVGVTTSFHYGDTRKISKSRVYTEQDFWNVSDLFKKRIGYRPDFISVINEENEQTALQNVRLAKEMDVECKLNYAMASGDQYKPYQLSKIYKIYVDVYNAGLAPWEYNTRQMMVRLHTEETTCPQSRLCDVSIRALNPGGDYYSCGSFGDDKEYPINFNNEIYDNQFINPLQQAPELHSLKDECLWCEMFKICNGCKKTIKDMKKHNMVQEHCTLMKKLQPSISKINKENHVHS